MRKLVIALLAFGALLSGVSAAEAQRWHGNRGYYGHRYDGHRYYGPRRGFYRPYRGHRGYYERRSYYRHGRRYWR